MSESQKHGFQFEKIVTEEKLIEINNKLKEKVGYTAEWDVPPISVKSFKFDTKTIEFGSIERIFKNEINFILVLIGYKQNKNIKEVVFSDALFICKRTMKSMKQDLEISIIEDLCSKIKSFPEGKHIEAREWAKKQKSKYNEKTKFDIRFKIDSKKQRRIQCALKLNDIYDANNEILIIDNHLNIQNIISNSRIRNNKNNK